jgi:exodeoxyribonuclease VII small subunit
MATTRKTKTPDFEKLLVELDKIVQRMEQGDQSLDQTLKDFERGMELSEQCQKSLDAAQQRVDKLVKKHGNFQLESMDEDLDDDEEEYDEESDYE